MNSSRSCIVLGSRSEIAQGLISLLAADDWQVSTWDRGGIAPSCPWSLLINCVGTVRPVGLWLKTGLDIPAFESNLLLPIRLLGRVWPQRQPGASGCFLAGSNPNTIMPGYTSYNVSKMALLKAVEQIDSEEVDTKLFALGPGTILTKIHRASEGWHNPKLEAARTTGEKRAEKIRRVYDCLKWCIDQPKNVIGGRNICVSDSQDWENETELAARLATHPHLFKLRRAE